MRSSGLKFFVLLQDSGDEGDRSRRGGEGDVEPEDSDLDASFVTAGDQADDVDADIGLHETTAVEFTLDEFMRKTEVSRLSVTADTTVFL